MPTVVQEKTRPILKKPALYRVIIFDDDITTFECVMGFLMRFFNKSKDESFDIAFEVDISGNSLAGIYTKDIAETKISLAKSELDVLQFPLKIEAFPCD